MKVSAINWKKKVWRGILVLTVVFGFACGKDPMSGPGGDDNPKRVYVWEDEALPEGGAWCLWGAAEDDVYAVGFDASRVYHYQQGRWSKEKGTGDDLYYGKLESVFGTPGFGILAVGSTFLRREAYSHWREMSGIPYMWSADDLWGADESHVYVVGQWGRIWRYNGSYWEPMESGVSDAVWLRGVAGSSKSDVIAVGTVGTVVQYDGIDWDLVDAGTAVDLFDVWVDTDGFAIVVGANGVALCRDAEVWGSLFTGTTDVLIAVYGRNATDVYAVGMNGTVLHFDGAEWEALEIGSSEAFTAVWVSEAGAVWIGSGYSESVLVSRP